VELGYFPGDNEFHCAASQTVAAPELGFLFPAFDDRAANIYNALFYARKPDQLHHEFIDGVFRTEPPLSAAEQKEAFQQALSEALGEDCSAQVVQALHEELAGRITLHKESKDPEPLTVTAAELAGILQACGVEPAQAEAFQSCCRERLGQGALNPENLIDAGRFQVKTAQATLTVAPEFSYTVETRTIQGRKYVLFPAEDGMEINGFAVTADAPHPETT
jgi:hypothetical protein